MTARPHPPPQRTITQIDRLTKLPHHVGGVELGGVLPSAPPLGRLLRPFGRLEQRRTVGTGALSQPRPIRASKEGVAGQRQAGGGGRAGLPGEDLREGTVRIGNHQPLPVGPADAHSGRGESPPAQERMGEVGEAGADRRGKRGRWGDATVRGPRERVDAGKRRARGSGLAWASSLCAGRRRNTNELRAEKVRCTESTFMNEKTQAY